MRRPLSTARLAFWGRLRESRVAARLSAPVHLDAETRSFLDRPSYSPPLSYVLRVVVVTAAAISVVKIGWILATYFIGG